MSYYMMDYSMTDPGTPGWQFAPVPGWGVNPAAAGPRRVGVGLLGFGQDEGARTVTDIEGRYSQTSYGMVAAVGAGALLLGVFLGYVAGKRAQKKLTANAARKKATRKKASRKTKRVLYSSTAAGRRAELASLKPPKKKGFDYLQAKWRDEPGTQSYLFEWTSDGVYYGGYNSVAAKSKKEAERRARQLGKAADKPGHVKLRLREGSVQPWSLEADRRYSRAFD